MVSVNETPGDTGKVEELMDAKYMAIGLVAVAAFSLLRIVSQWRGMSRKRRPDRLG